MPGPPSHSVLALIKASKPSFHSPSAKLSFAAHAICALNGFKLLAAGDTVDHDPLPDPSGPEVDVEGWNKNMGEYSFLYGLETAAPPGSTLLLKCLALGGTLLVTVLADIQTNHRAPSTALPETLELELQSYVASEGADPSVILEPRDYGHLQKLSDLIQAAIESQLEAIQSSQKTPTKKASVYLSSSNKATTNSGSVEPRSSSQMEEPSHLGSEDHNLPRGPSLVPQRSPLMVGDGDLMPWGVFDPLRVPPGERYSGGFGPTGGMHVGPGHPFFSDRLRNPGLASGAGVGGGMMPGGGVRWDPIAPEGLQGWHPEDFQRGASRRGDPGPPVHPDMMQPGPGRGADWDHMFG